MIRRGKRIFWLFFEELEAKLSVSENGFRDNIVMERFRRTYKYECVYLWDKMDLKELREKAEKWVSYYNSNRLHQALEYKTPDGTKEYHFGMN